MASNFFNFDLDPANPTAYEYTAAEWREIQMDIVSNGIILNAGIDIATDTSLKVTSITGGVNIADGKIAIQGAFATFTNTVAENVLIDTDGTYKIIMEFNSVLGKIYSKTITNATALTRTATVWQLQLATVVKSGTTYTVTDTRADANVCGYANRITNIASTIYPVGSIYISINNVNPTTYFGGTWIAFGAGQTLVGVDTAQTEFNTVEKSGGAKTHTLTTSEIPAHEHAISTGAGQAISTGTGTTTGIMGLSANTGNTTYATAKANNNSGGGLAHNNLQPYITVYFWKRTA